MYKLTMYNIIAKLKYVGKSKPLCLTNGVVYNCYGFEGGMLRILDDEEDMTDGVPGYLYSPRKPLEYGRFEVIEDYSNGLITRVINGY